MNNTPSLNEKNKTANMNPNLLTRHYKLKLMDDFLHIKYQNPKTKQSEISNQIGLSSSTVQRYRNDINVFSLYRVQSNNVKNDQKRLKWIISVTSKDLKRLQMTSGRPQTKQLKIKRTN